MTSSLVITTYNWPEALELTLLSIFLQSTLPLEVIVADDGSTDETRRLIERLAAVAPLPIVHSWQEDHGFRLARSRNKAIAIAKGDYIISIDGDIILDRHFVQDHMDTATPGYFIQGPRVILSESKTREIMDSGDVTLTCFSLGVANRKNCIRSKWLSTIFSRKDQVIRGTRGCNSSFWRADAVAVNGFNEDFVGWGREDSEFACRLINAGLRRHNLRFLATAYHLHHDMCARNQLAVNNQILRTTVEQRIQRCTNGLAQHLLAA